MTEQDIFEAAELFSTQQYGPLYIVSGSHARGRTFRVWLLDPGQQLSPSSRMGPNNPHYDLREDQLVFGVVAGQPGWTEEYGWIKTHYSVRDGTAPALLEQLIRANEQALALGVAHPRERHAWLNQWASQHLGHSESALALDGIQLSD